MKFRFKHAAAAAIAGLFLSAAPSAEATLTFTGGGGDLTFFYDSTADRWDIVFRNKGATQATGNTNVYAGFTGIVGLNSGDRTFNDLQVNVSSAPLQSLNGNDYFITPANGSTIYNDSSGNPDLGMRTRLREDTGDEVFDQFDSMRLTLDWAASTRPAGAEFALFGWDAFSEPANILYETASSNFSHDWDNYGHDHWHFGFSEVGDYSLVFNVSGIGGLHGDDAGTSQVTVNFNVIPEPSSALLSMLAIGAIGFRRRRN